MVERIAALLSKAMGQFQTIAWASENSNAPLLKRLDPPRQAQVLMVLLGLLLLGGLLIAVVVLGGRRMRRIARQRPAPSRRADDPWYQKPLVPPPSDPTGHEPQ